MIKKNLLFDKLIRGTKSKINQDDNEEVRLVERYTDVMLAKKFGWTYDEIMGLPVSFYDDCVLIISKENAIQDHENKKNAKRSKRR